MNFWKNKTVVSGLFSVVLAGLMAGIALSGTLQTLQLKLADNMYRAEPPNKDIVIVKVDDKTIEELGEFARWERDIYAQALENISAHNPKVVGFDFLFFSNRNEETDQQFYDAMLQSPASVVIGFFGESFLGERGVESTDIQFPIYDERDNIRIASLDILQDEDEVIRRAPLTLHGLETGETYDSFSALIARLFLGRELSIPTEDEQMMVNFQVWAEASSTYDSLSFVDAYNDDFGSIDPSGKIVLIGPYSDSFQDTFLTPLSSSFAIPGVEIHANAIQTILEGDFLRYMSPFEKIALMLLLAFGSCYVFMFTRIRWSLAFLGGFIVIYTVLAPILFGVGIIVDLVHPYLTVLVAFMAVYIYRYLTEFKSKLALKSAFSRYVNPSVADQIAENPDSLQLGGAKKDITVIFTDIAHFTTISEQLSAESLVAFLNEYLEAMSEVIMAEGGTVDKFEGDAIMAFFGAPINQPDHALRAVRAALNMRLRLQELHQKWQKDPVLPGGEKKPLIDFRCGISSGQAIVGNIGSAARLEYTAMGDIVNLGSRLEGANKQYSTNVMMSEETLKRVQKEVISRELDLIRVVGKQQPVRVYELLGLAGAVDRNAEILLTLYNDGIRLYSERKFNEALTKFEEILKSFPEDGPSKLYKQRCEVLKDFPPKADWDGVFDMKSK